MYCSIIASTIIDITYTSKDGKLHQTGDEEHQLTYPETYHSTRYANEAIITQELATDNTGHVRSLTQILYNAEGDLLFTAGKDPVFNVWFTSNGERLGTFNGHNGTIWSISCDCMSPSRLPFGKRKKADQVAKSKYIVSGAADSSMKLWDIQSGKCLYTWDFLTAVKRVQFRLVFLWVFSTVADGVVRMIKVS